MSNLRNCPCPVSLDYYHSHIMPNATSLKSYNVAYVGFKKWSMYIMCFVILTSLHVSWQFQENGVLNLGVKGSQFDG